MNLVTLLMFVFSTIGMSHIIVDGSIMQWFRDLLKFSCSKFSQWLITKTGKNFFEHIASFGSVVDCYLCCGTWCGFFMGWVWISSNPFKILACGCAGGFLSQIAAAILNLIETLIVGNIEDKHGN